MSGFISYKNYFSNINVKVEYVFSWRILGTKNLSKPFDLLEIEIFRENFQLKLTTQF